MPDHEPVWRRGFDTVEGAFRPRLENIIQADQFAVVAGFLAGVRHEMQRRTERATRRLLHACNLPAASDVTRILAEVGRLERDVASVSRRLDMVKEARADDDDRKPPRRPARTRPA